MHVSAHTLEPCLDILVLEFKPFQVRIRDDEQIQAQRQAGNERGRKQIRNHHSVETDSAG